MKKIIPIFLFLVIILTTSTFASTFETSVKDSADDAWYYNGGWSTAGISIFLGKFENKGRENGLRFQSITIPQGSVIDSAFLEIEARQNQSKTICSILIIGEDTASAMAFSTSANYLSRIKTTTIVQWSPIPQWTADSVYKSPNIASVIQEIIDRSDWSSGNDLALFIRDTSSADGAYRVGKSYNYQGSEHSPRLLIYYTYTLAAGGTSDSIGIDTGSGWGQWIYPAYLKEGSNMTFTISGDTLTIAGEAGGGSTDSTDVAGWNFATKKDVGDTAIIIRDDIHDTAVVLRADSSKWFKYVTDIDTITKPAVTGNTLKWNGSKWIPAPYDSTFAFSIASFSDGQYTTQLIGSGTWKTTGNLSFTTSYNNGPPTSAYINLQSDGGVSWASNLNLTTPFTSGVSAENTAYPSAKDKYIRFYLNASKGAENDIEYESYIYFRNYIFWGTSTINTGFTEADIEGLSGKDSTNSTTISKTINSSSGLYIVYAYPSSYTDMDDGNDYEEDGGTDFTFNSLPIAMTRTTGTLSITNPAGYGETYEVYASDLANLGNYTFSASTTDKTINYIRYGVTLKTSGFNEADIEGLANSSLTNDNTQIWSSVTVGTNEYYLWSCPKRLGLVSFWIGGFEGGFGSPESLSVTNVMGWSEDYYCWRSSNHSLGATVVETKAP